MSATMPSGKVNINLIWNYPFDFYFDDLAHICGTHYTRGV